MAVGTQCRTDNRQAFFLPNTIRDWNNLPDEPSLGEYDPQFFLCCHNVVPSEKRIGTKVWSCAFEPSLEYPGETGNILATCGGRTVCFIDVVTGLMMKRFQDNVKKEDFYTMAWTTIEDHGKKMNILAVGGRGCRIKLIYPEQLMYYSTITGHKKYINCLMFHPRKPNILFSGSLDGFIIIWDIGKPGAERTFNRTALLKLKTSTSIGDPLCLTYDSRGNVLVAVTEKGFVGWKLRKIPLPTAKTAPTFTARIVGDHSYIFAMPKKSSSAAQSRRSKKKTPLKKGQMDCLVAMDYGLVATKCVGGEDIWVWSLDDTLSSGGFRKYVKVTEPLLRLVYPEMREKYINMGYSNGVLSVGSDNGTIYLYDVDDMIYAITSPVTMPMKPSEVLEWPEVDGLDDDDDDSKTNGPGGSKEGDGVKLKEKDKETKVVLNMVVMSSDRNVVAAGTDNNLVCIWHRTQD